MAPSMSSCLLLGVTRLVADLLETSYSDFLLLYTDGFVDNLHKTATAACHIPSLGVNLSGRLNYSTTSTTAELCAIRLVLQYLLHLQTPSKVVILTDSRAALFIIHAKVNGTLFSRETFDDYRAVEDAGCILRLQWMPSHVGILGNDVAGHLAKTAHQDKEPTMHISRPVEARYLLRRTLRLRYPDVRVATGVPPAPVPHRDMSRADGALLHCLRCNSAFTGVILHRIDRH